MRLLVIGSGGREHALCSTFKRQGHQVWCLPGNAGTKQLSEPLPPQFQTVDPNDFSSLAELAKELQIDLTVVGPEQYLEKGIVDFFEKQSLPIFGPSKKAAQLESSKAWSKEFMRKHKIPTAEFQIFKEGDACLREAKKMIADCGGVVIKPSGLTGGKGVVCCREEEEAKEAIDAIVMEKKYGSAGNEIIAEELLEGKEISILAFCDGKAMVPMLPSQDHKRLLDKDQGPNTGGVGAYSPAPFVTAKIMEEIQKSIIDKTQMALSDEGILYRGVLYFGLMLTEKGPKVLEFNCRFGDPEAQAVLPLLDSDLAAIMKRCIEGELAKMPIQWKPKVSCCVVMCSGGYPGGYRTGYSIEGLDQLPNHDLDCFHAGTACEKDKIVTSSGRVLGVTALGDNMEEAVEKAYLAIRMIRFQDAHYRTDIAHQAIIKKQ